MSLQIQHRTAIQRIDYNLMFVVAALNIIGLFVLFSATHGSQLGDLNRLFYQQIVWLLVGWALFLILTFVEYRFILRLGYLLFGINVVALGLVNIIGKYYYGAQRWLNLGFFHYQPSETMKLVLILVFAHYFSRKSYPNGLGFRDLILPSIFAGIPFVLVVKQPDLGTAMLIAIITAAMLLFVKLRAHVLITALVLAMTVIPVAWSFFLKDYQKNRVLTFIDPSRDPRGSGYNSIQSRIAVGSGRWFGKGFRKGTQGQLEFLPERHTDFIFSVLAEEFGLAGSLLTIGIFTSFLLLGVRIASQARDKAGALLTVGILAMVFAF